MRVDEFDFHLPEDRIALRPAEPRDSARMLVVRQDGAMEDRIARDLPQFLRAGDIMVFNDTRVIPAQLTARRAPRAASPLERPQPLSGPRIGLTLHKRLGPNVWLAFARPAKKLEPGDHLSVAGELQMRVEERHDGGEVMLVFEWEGAALDAAIARLGETPLPPYIASKRPPDERDLRDYQTIYAANDGSVAAPTAGLHFTPALLAALDARGVMRETVTLHVGAGTFLPVKADDTRDHKMHAEWGVVSHAAAARINEARAKGGRLICVGTTSMRLIESAADSSGKVHLFAGETDIFITPGTPIRACDVLMTNFHLPRSTLFMLVSAFMGQEVMRKAYAHAIAAGYRFYSYGDTSLLFRAGRP